jgi:hypothetical protein
MHRTLVFISVFAFISFLYHSVMAQDDLNVFSKGDNQWLHFTDAPNALYHHLAGEAYAHLEKRTQAIRSLSSLQDWKQRQQWISSTLMEIVGPFPAKSPLNARILKTVDKGAFRVEHIVFESQPSFYVTASLFIPNGLRKKDKAPAIVYCSGHAEEGYRSPVYQRVIVNLVKKGFVVFAFDPVGQGERLEYLEEATSKSSVGGPTSQHSYPGSQAFITGSSQARYMIWDGIRAVDYLFTRKEVDPLRIGITGRSGGGTQAAYIAAFDDRIKASAPECYITNFTRLLQSIGPQDAEQNFPQGISRGLDHADLLLVRAPKPALMITTTRDMFSIQGARETAGEVSAIYKAYGQQGNFGMVEDDAPHASTKKNREAMYAFFQKYLDNAGSATDEEVPVLTADEIKVTPTGQIATSLGGETVFTLNRTETQLKIEALKRARQNSAGNSGKVTAEAKILSGYREPGEIHEPVFAGRISRNGYAVEKYFLKGEGDYVIPYLLLVPDRPNNKTVIYLHPKGKNAEASPGGEMEWFAKNGFRVLAPDLAGAGEMGGSDFTGDAFIGGVSHNIWYCSILIGRSIVGLQAGDIARLIRMQQKNSGPIYAIAKNEMTPVLLHAAAFLPAIERIALIEPLSSYRAMVVNRSYPSSFITAAVAGSLNAYDLPDLAAALVPRKLLLASVVDASSKGISEDLSVISKAYSDAHVKEELQIIGPVSQSSFDDVFKAWLD